MAPPDSGYLWAAAPSPFSVKYLSSNFPKSQLEEVSIYGIISKKLTFLGKLNFPDTLPFRTFTFLLETMYLFTGEGANFAPSGT